MALRKVLSGVLLVACSTGCTLAGAPRSPAPVREKGQSTRPTDPDSSAAPSGVAPGYAEAHEIALGVVERAFQVLGTPYRWGGTDANGFDCSGLIRYAYAQYGIDLPRTSRDQLREGTPVELRVGALLPGDILGFSDIVGSEAAHVGLYVGDGEFIHSSPRGVLVSDLRQPYWRQHFVAARRLVQ